MTISIDSIKKVIDYSNCKEVMAYGLGNAGWTDIGYSLRGTDIAAYEYAKYPFRQLDYDLAGEEDGDTARKCKATIVSLIAENAKRIIENKPIVPLIFTIGKDGDCPITLDIERVASSRDGSYTNKELRRCYKIYAETTPEIKAVAAQTFKFVKLKFKSFVNRSDFPEYTYDLEEIKPFWKDPCWDQAWKKRHAVHKESQEIKKYPWKKMLQDDVAKTLSAVNISCISIFKPAASTATQGGAVANVCADSSAEKHLSP